MSQNTVGIQIGGTPKESIEVVGNYVIQILESNSESKVKRDAFKCLIALTKVSADHTSLSNVSIVQTPYEEKSEEVNT